MKLTLTLTLLLASAPSRAEIIDRIVAIVGRQMITWSDVQREARLEAYADGQKPPAPLHERSPEYRELLERLIQQRLILHEMDQAQFPAADEKDVQDWLKKLTPAGVKLADYGLREQDLLEYSRRIARVDRFVELRFNRAASPRATARTGSYSDPNRSEKSDGQGISEEHEMDHWLKDLRTRVGVRVIETENIP